MAEREGFEPSIRTFEPYAGLANRCLKPLGHRSSLRLERHHSNPSSSPFLGGKSLKINAKKG